MTAAIGATTPYRNGGPTGPAVLAVARILRIELRRNEMPWILPLVAALFWFDSYRYGSQLPLWSQRTFWNMGQGHALLDIGPFAAGVAAWVASRDGRRETIDLVTAVARPRWTLQLTAWAATAIWAVGAYVVFVGVMFAVYAYQGVAGTPPWWWVAVGVAAIAAFSAAGFAIGALWPSRFAAPVAAFGGFLAWFVSFQVGLSHASGWALILPNNTHGNFGGYSGIFYPWMPDLPIVRMMGLGGIAIMAVSLLGLLARAGGPRLRRVATMAALAGVAATGVAVGLAATAVTTPLGAVIPALHDAASDRPIPYTPVCRQVAGVQICLNPAYRRLLADVTAALRPVLAEVAGLPGAPARAAQVAELNRGNGEAGQPMTITGDPPVLRMPLDCSDMPSPFSCFRDAPWSTARFEDDLRLLAVHAFVGAGNGPGTPAQQAVQSALLQGAHIPFNAQPIQLLFAWAQPNSQDFRQQAAAAHGPRATSGPIYAAARRLTAMSPAARRAWLATHLSALRAGQLTLNELP